MLEPDGVGLGFYLAAWVITKGAVMRFLDAFPKDGWSGDTRSIQTSVTSDFPAKILIKLLTSRLQNTSGKAS